MSDFETDRLIYLAILLGCILVAFIASGRISWLKTMQQAAAWTLIILLTVAGVGIFMETTEGPRQLVTSEEGRIVATRQRDGHYHLTLQVNNVPVDFLVDTGATNIVLTRADAARAGLNPDNLQFFGRANTANGEVTTAPVRLETVALGPVTDQDVYAVVNGGEMDTSLLGMGYLQRWGKIEITGGELILTR